ncbi:MAG: sulfotransferase family protein, partial [Gammaproteobacteria bacterium]
MKTESKPAARPNLFLVGAMKSGSSTLTRYLREHPAVFMARKPKEPSYFVAREQLREVYPAIEKMGFWRSEGRYLGLFADAGDCSILGDASQNYARLSKVTGVAERIARFNPEARILYIMRDPVERTIS